MKATIVLGIFLMAASALFPADNTPVSGVTGSAEVADGHPAELAVDGDPSTCTSFRQGARRAELRIDLTARGWLKGIDLEVSLPDGVVLGVETAADGIRRTLASSVTAGTGGRVFLDLAGEFAVTDHLILTLGGERLAEAAVHEVRPALLPVLVEPRPVELRVASATVFSSWLSNEFSLIDGQAGTSWEFLCPEDYHGIPGEMLAILQGRFPASRETSRWREGFVTLAVPEPVAADKLKVYLDDSADGLLKLEVKADGAWLPAGALYMDRERKGWRDFPLGGRPVVQEIRLTVNGIGLHLGGIGEVELWARAEQTGPSVLPVAPFDPNGPGPECGFFNSADLESGKDYLLQGVFRRGSAPAEATLNGLPLAEAGRREAGGCETVLFRPAEGQVAEGVNVVAVPPEAAAGLLALQLVGRRTAGEVGTAHPDLQDGRLFSGPATQGEEVLLSPEPAASLEGVEIFHGGDAPYQFFQVRDRRREWLTPVEQGDGYVRLQPGAGAEAVGFRGGTVTEVRLSGSDCGLGRPRLELIAPAAGWPFAAAAEPPRYVVGLTDAPDADLRVNGRPAAVRGNTFWVPLEQVLEETGLQTIRVQADHRSRGSSTLTREFMVPAERITVILDQGAGLHFTEEESFTVSGRVSGFGASLAVDGRPVDLRGGSFSFQTPVRPGLNLIVVELKDFRGNLMNRLYLRVLRYAGPMEIRVAGPEDGACLTASAVDVCGSIVNDLPARVLINGSEARLSGTSFASRAPVPLDQAANPIRIEAWGAGGRTVQKTIMVLRDLEPPVIGAIAPAGESWHGTKSVVVSGEARDANGAAVFVNGQQAQMSGDGFSVRLPLQDGRNEIRVVARDRAGNTAAADPFWLNVDTVPPEAYAVQAEPAGWTNNTRPVVTFTTRDDGSGMDHYEVSIAGRAFVGQLSPYRLPHLEDGSHLIRVRAVDRLGNFREAGTTVYIDTVPPDAAGAFRAVPGNGEVLLRWYEDDGETVAYRVGRADLPGAEEIEVARGQGEAGSGEETGKLYFECRVGGLANGSHPSFHIQAVDRAGNVGPKSPAAATVGVAEAPYAPQEGTEVEYAGVNLFIRGGSLPEETAAVQVTEVECGPMEAFSTNPIISPVFSFSLVKEGEEGQRHAEFEENYVGLLRYDESQVPEDFPEENLGVYFFDPMWSRWLRVPDCVVDTANNQILFATNHFSEFSIQPTVVEDCSPQELKDVQFSPFETRTAHQPVTVSPQGGTAMTSMTEFVLPGRNGFDFELRRIYDTATARGDAAGLNLNLSIGISDLTNPDAIDLAAMAGQRALAAVTNAALKYFQNNGDYAYSTGQGWRLNLPYVRWSNGTVMLRLPDGGFHDITEMDKRSRTEDSSSVSLGPARHLVFENHEGGDFTFDITQVRSAMPLGLLTGNSADSFCWILYAARLRTRDGMTYLFDGLGRVTEIVSPDGNNRQTFHYDGLTLDYVEDSLGRRVRFAYSNVFETVMPQIDRVWIEDDPQGRQVRYEYDTVYTALLGAPLPLLEKAIDVGGRAWEYSYDDQFLFAASYGIKINIIALIGDILTGGVFSQVAGKLGLQSVEVHAGMQAQWVFVMDGASGAGIGRNTLEYDRETLEYLIAQGGDYFLGLFPTAIQVDIGMRQQPVVARHVCAGDESTPSITRGYDYDFEHAGKGQFYSRKTVVTDGSLKEIYEYEVIRKTRCRWIDWSDTLADFLSSPFTENPYYPVYIPVNTRVDVFDQAGGTLLESRLTAYDRRTLRPTEEIHQRSGGQSMRTAYEYDDWGNVARQTVTLQADERVLTTTTWSYYACTGSSPAVGIAWPENPLGPSPIDEDLEIHDRLLGQAVRYTIANPGDEPAYGYRYTYLGYDERGRETARAARVGGDWAITRTTYNADGLGGEVETVSGPEGHLTRFDYDYTGLPGYYTVTRTEKEVRDADGAAADLRTSTGYHRHTGLPAWTTDGRGYTSEYRYDRLGRKTLVRLPDDGDALGWTPAAGGDPARADNPATAVVYDDAAYTATVTDPEGGSAVYDFDPLGRLMTIEKRNRFDEQGNPLSGPPRSIVTTLAYDARGNVTAVTDPNGRATNYEYDALKRLKKEIFPEENGVRPARSYDYNYFANLQEITDERGYRTREYHDMQDRLLQQLRLGFDGEVVKKTSYFYDALGNRTAVVDHDGNVTTTEYNELGLPACERKPEGGFLDAEQPYRARPWTRITYDRAGHKTGEYTSSVRGEDAVTFTVDGLGRILSTTAVYTDPAGQARQAVTKQYHDAAGNVVRTVDPLGHETRVAYTARNKPAEQRDALGNRTTFAYDKKDRQVSMTDPRGSSGAYPGLDFTLEYRYDDLDRLIEGRLPSRTAGAAKPTVRLVYDDRGNLTARIEPDGGRTGYTYSPRNLPLTETRAGTRADGSALSFTVTREYDAAGNLVAVTQPDGTVTRSEYDTAGRKTVEVLPSGARLRYAYDGRDNLVSQTSGNGFVTRHWYDELSRLVKSQDPEYGVSEFGYDQKGNRVVSRDPAGHLWKSRYDELGRVIEEIDNRGLASTLAYDAAGNLARVTDPRGTTITYGYTPTNLVESIVYLNGGQRQIQAFLYDEAGEPKQAADGPNVTRYNQAGGAYAPDPYGLRTSVAQEAGGRSYTLRYDYDLMRRLSGITGSDGTRVGYDYNNLGLLESMPGYIDQAPSYDAAGLLTGYTLANRTRARIGYDANHRLASLSHQDRRGRELKGFTYRYDLDDNLIERNEDAFGYDRKGQLASAMLVGEAGVEEYEPDRSMLAAGAASGDVVGEAAFELAGEALTVDWGARSLGIDLGYAYKVRRVELTPDSRSHRLAEDKIAVYASLYNQEDGYGEPLPFSYSRSSTTGQVTLTLSRAVFARYLKIHSHFNELDAAGAPQAGAATFTVRKENIRVTAVTGGRNEFYQYAPDGNRLVAGILAQSMSSTAYRYYEGCDLVRTAGAFAYRYDANGNLVEKGNRYTEAGGEPAIEAAGEYFRYEYDLLNRLIRVHRYDAEAGAVVQVASYGYNADNLRVYRRDRAGQETFYLFDESGNLLEEHGAAGDTWYVYRKRRHLAKRTASGTFFYGTDHLGSTVVMSDSTGQGVWSGEASPFGEKVEAEGAAVERLKYTGKELDAETGLYYFNARWYDASLGRFTTEDPARSGLAWYVYANNNPLRFTDPSGLDPIADKARSAFDSWSQSMIAAQDKAQQQEEKLRTQLNKADPVAFAEKMDLFRSGKREALGTEYLNASDMLQTTQALNAASPEVLAWVENQSVRGSVPAAEQITAQAIKIADANEKFNTYGVPALYGALGLGMTASTAARVAPKTIGVAEEIAAAAKRAGQVVGEGKGPVHGTKVHTAFKAEVNGLANPNIRPEVSYLNGREVDYGTPGAVRIDAEYGLGGRIIKVWDLKTGSAELTPQRIQQIQAHITGGANVPVTEVRP